VNQRWRQTRRRVGQRLLVLAAFGVASVLVPGSVAEAAAQADGPTRADVLLRGTGTPVYVELGTIIGPVGTQDCPDPEPGGCTPPPPPNHRGACFTEFWDPPFTGGFDELTLSSIVFCELATGADIPMETIEIRSVVRNEFTGDEFTRTRSNSHNATLNLFHKVALNVLIPVTVSVKGTVTSSVTLPSGWSWSDPNFHGVRTITTEANVVVNP
jgi:hypothetical protein